MRLVSLFDIPICGIYALVHHKSRRMSLYYTSNMVQHLLRKIEDIQNKRVRDAHLIRFRKDYEFEVIEEFKLPTTEKERVLQKTRILDIEKEYTNRGFVVGRSSNTPKFRFVTELLDNGTIKLLITNKNNNRFVLGIFDTKQACEDYKTQIKEPKYVVCNNELTTGYLNLHPEE